MTGWQDGPETSERRCCFKCLADFGFDHPFTDFGREATWRKTLIGHREFLDCVFTTCAYMSGVFKFPGFQYSYIDYDLMHCSDLGILLVLEANILWEIFKDLGGTWDRPGNALAQLLLMIRLASKRLRMQPPINNLTMTMIRKSGQPPKMALKAAEARHLLPVLCYIQEKIMPPKNPHDELRAQCTKHMNNLYEELVAWCNAPGDLCMHQTRTTESGRRHVLLYAELAREALDATGECMFWRIYPKHHAFLHVIEDQLTKCGNPRRHWCYGDEDAIGDVADMAEGLHPSTLHRSVVDKTVVCARK